MDDLNRWSVSPGLRFVKCFPSLSVTVLIAVGVVGPFVGFQVQYTYRIKYRHSRSGAVGMTILHTAAEVVAERARLEALGHVVTNVLVPIGERPRAPLVP
jgi:hypothetical protein